MTAKTANQGRETCPQIPLQMKFVVAAGSKRTCKLNCDRLIPHELLEDFTEWSQFECSNCTKFGTAGLR